ncbi:gamma-secretase subunit PEN-2-like [Saccoglossus kowalevskii]|uniref:Gamma-secretase subunit PEN-2 n=1 Tax=Saccoglossus kowalevskii TaxID=10224 RepID=A0ABM0GKQ6_SACKO|nr:PREDICTED: gamma-secretase subunit PEN-2-like [Saccoglossus kowalevskii]
MDLKRVANPDKLDLCRTYYKGGFFCLPFLWIVNFIWFFKDAFIKEEFPQQKQMRTYIIHSAIGSVVWLAIIASWVVVYQIYRPIWQPFADYIAFIIPKGIP